MQIMVSLSFPLDTIAVSDRDLERSIEKRLVGRQIFSLRQIRVTAERGMVTLRGTVTSFYQKQLCIQTCSGVPGLRQLVDEVEVDSIM